MMLRSLVFVVVASAVVVASDGSASTAEPSSVPHDSSCPVLEVFGIQGTGESSPDASPKSDTGMLGEMFRPMMAHASGLIDRTYVAYSAGFGGVVPGGGALPYRQSVEDAMSGMDRAVTAMAKRCPYTLFAGAGYSQGAHAMSMWAKRVGANQGPIPADRVAGVVLLADPARPKDSPVLPGRTGAVSPEPVPGTGGTAVSKISLAGPQPPGSGIGPFADVSQGYGALAGRVADICAPGDLACAAPDHASLLHVIANVAGQSKLNPMDPITAISTIAQALATTTFKAAVPVINNDVQGRSLDQISYRPRESISQRLAEASDPRTPVPSGNDALSAWFKVGTIAFNAVNTVALNVFTPETIAALATVGLTDPVAAAAVLGAKLVSAVSELVPPSTQSRLVGDAWQALRDNVTDNHDLFAIATWIRYSDTIAKHQSYASAAMSPTGRAAVQVAAEWFAAAAHDIADSRSSR